MDKEKDCYGKPEIYQPADFEGSEFPPNTVMVTHEQNYKCLGCDLFEGCEAEFAKKVELKRSCGPYYSSPKFDPKDIECMVCPEMVECRALRIALCPPFAEQWEKIRREIELRNYRRVILND